jgi:hypothetical protein
MLGNDPSARTKVRSSRGVGMRQSVWKQSAMSFVAVVYACVLHRLPGNVELQVLPPALPALPPLMLPSLLYQV